MLRGTRPTQYSTAPLHQRPGTRAHHLQFIKVQPLPANTVNGSGRDMPIFTTRLAPADATAYSVVTDWSGESPRADGPAGPPLASSRSDYAFRLDSQSVVGTAQLYGPVNLAAMLARREARRPRSTETCRDWRAAVRLFEPLTLQREDHVATSGRVTARRGDRRSVLLEDDHVVDRLPLRIRALDRDGHRLSVF